MTIINKFDRMRKCLFILLFFIPNRVWAQAYMHEVAEDSDGNPIFGLFALAIIFGLVYLISKFRESIKEDKRIAKEIAFKRELATSVSESSLERYKEISIFQNNSFWRKGYINATYDIQNNKIRRLYNKSIDDLIVEYKKSITQNSAEANKIMTEIGYFEHLKHNNEILIKEGRNPFNYIVSTEAKNNLSSIKPITPPTTIQENCIYQKEDKNKDFINKCITIYGDYTEIVHGCLSIKEDGEYRIIKSDDPRYESLYDYVYENHNDRICPSNPIYNYLRYNIDTFPLAKPIDKHGILEKEFYGGRIIALRAYYCKTFFAPNAIPLNDFILGLGYEVAIYLHKYIEIPMDFAVYHDFKIMQIQGFTFTEYKEYRKKAGQWHEDDEGWFDGWWGFIGKTYSEARENYDKKEGFTFQEALDETAKIEWHL